LIEPPSARLRLHALIKHETSPVNNANDQLIMGHGWLGRRANGADTSNGSATLAGGTRSVFKTTSVVRNNFADAEDIVAPAHSIGNTAAIHCHSLLIRGGTLVTHEGERAADVGIEGGCVETISPALSDSGRQPLDATGLYIFPALIDSHVHFNEPGRADWEGIATGSRALAAGGGTLFFDMPLNAHPPVLDASSFEQKLAAAMAASLVDFGLWGGLVPGNLEQLEDLHERGVIGFKAFMSNSGIDDFPRADDRTLGEGMKRIARFGGLVGVHAESETITSELAQSALANSQTSIRDYLNSRPIHAELDAITRAIDMAGETGCRLHIVHVSCGAGVALVASAQQLGVDVTCETCPHYLALTEDDMTRIGPLAKCAPPLRAKSAQDSLWQYVLTDQVATIGSDHSPSPPGMKTDSNFFNVWGGISGVQHTLPLLLTEGHRTRHADLAQIARLTSFNVAKRFQLPTNKGSIEPGCDADFALIALDESFVVQSEQLLYKHRQTPYAGRTLTGRVVQTILRGQTVFKNGKIVAEPLGRFVRPS
jgi:allantoinase